MYTGNSKVDKNTVWVYSLSYNKDCGTEYMIKTWVWINKLPTAYCNANLSLKQYVCWKMSVITPLWPGIHSHHVWTSVQWGWGTESWTFNIAIKLSKKVLDTSGTFIWPVLCSVDRNPGRNLQQQSGPHTGAQYTPIRVQEHVVPKRAIPLWSL